MDKLNNAIAWFDIPVTDMQRATRFHETLFDRKLKQLRFDNGLEMALFEDTEGNRIALRSRQ